MQQQSGGQDKGNFQKIGEGLGGLMGQAADSAMGLFGGMMSNMGGWWAQTAQRQGGGGFSAAFSSDRDSECRRHFQGQAGGTVKDYEDARPLYQFGHMAGQNPDYQGRSFDQVEMDLQRNWGDEQQRRYGGWPDVRGFVEFGYAGKSGSASGSGSGGGFQASGSTGGGSGFQASAQGSTGSGGFQASGEAHTDRDGGGLHGSGGAGGGGTSGGFHASGEIDSKDR